MIRVACAATILVLAAPLGACGSPQARESASAEAEDDVLEAEPAASGPSPLIEFLGYETSGAGATAEFERLINEETRACMERAGFEYHPPPPAPARPSEREVLAVRAATREWTEQWGFGVSTQAFSQVEVGPGLRGYEPPPVDTSVDRNQAYYGELGPDEQRAYQEALLGPEGCIGTATELAVSSMRNEGFIEEFSDELQALDEQVLTDPRVVDYERGVAECVREQGYDYTTMDDATERFSLATAAVTGDGAGSEDDRPESGGEPAPVGLSPAQLADLAALQEQEIELALAAFDCGGNLAELWRIQDEVRNDLERQFVEENRSRLEAFVVSDS